MNRIYRLIWNADLYRWLVVPEIAKRHGKAEFGCPCGCPSRSRGFCSCAMRRIPVRPLAMETALCYLVGITCSRCRSWCRRLPAPQGIVADGRTQTAVASHGAVTNITTGTVRVTLQPSAPSMSARPTANLFSPNGTLNLINLRARPAHHEGILTRTGDGRSAATVHFRANPNGFRSVPVAWSRR